MVNPKASPKMPYDGPPLSVMMAASMVSTERFDIRIIDWHDKGYEERVRSSARVSPVIGLTCMTGYQISTMLEAARWAKEANPEIKVVVGGCHATLMPEQTLEHPLVDWIVVGQGVRTFAELMDCVAGGGDIATVPGVGFKRDGHMRFSPERDREEIEAFPTPPYHLLENPERFLVRTSFAERTLYYLTSEGCTGKCKFCAEESLYHRRWRPRSVDKVIEDIRKLRERMDFDGIAIADSNFYVDQRRVVEFCEKIEPLGLAWGGTSGRPDQLKRYKDETFALMKRSGLADIFLGVESGSDETLRIMDKGAKVADTFQVLPRLHAAGIRVQCSFIIGAPGVDIRRDFRETMRFINRLRVTGHVSQFHLFVFTPLPGTRFLEDSVKLGYQVPQKLEDWSRYELHAHTTPWVPPKYAMYTDAASVYFMFMAGHAEKVVRGVLPKRLIPLGVLAARILKAVSVFRVKHAFFAFPIEYRIIKWVLLHKERFFGDKSLMF